MNYFMLDSTIVKDRKLVIAFYIGYTDTSKTYILTEGEFKEVEENYQWSPTFYLDVIAFKKDGIGQTMLDALLAKGIKPTKPIENKEQLKEIKYHLEDMRKLVFSQIKGGKV
jgi:hypothetical protein